ncbi:hypothetical protein EFE32_12970 [Lactococcus lactis subsp. lactis]|uniref:hypothetical protein n=1 Tax=Lactococcus lactis TaxID=1358 RepID=UPI00223B047B|nr:hypothetical protein [Lactococcus lactis]MCT0017683.1 hypothetical protein [Lactococcus lactis subsp. lactis]
MIQNRKNTDYSTHTRKLNVPVKAIENAVIELNGEVFLLKELFKFEARQTVFGGVRITLTDGIQLEISQFKGSKNDRKSRTSR